MALPSTPEELHELLEARETVRAIRRGEVDAFVVDEGGAYRIATLSDADTPYRVLVESMQEGAVMMTGDGGVLYCNARFAAAIERTVPEIVGSNVTRWLVLDQAIDALLGQSLEGEVRCEGTLRAARRLIPVSVSGCALPMRAGASVYCLVISDVSDRVSAEHLRREQQMLARQRAELAAICDWLPFAVMIAESEGFTYMNPAAESLFMRAPRLREDARAAADRVLDSREPEHREVALQASRSTEWIFEVHTTELSVEGPTQRIMVVIEDVTAAREARRAREHQEQLREAFIGIVGHDLRNPLMAIQAATQLLRDPASKDKHRLASEAIDRSIARMRRLIDDMLDLTLARIGGGIPVVATSTDLGEVVRSAIDELQTQHPEAQFALTIEGDLRGMWDGARLGQVMGNLLGNALQHGDASRPITVRLDGQSPLEVTLEVANEGPPIDPALLPTIFDPFKRATSNVRGSGVGLGLYIAERIVRGHGGFIDVVSSDADGTRLTITLPRSIPTPSSPPSALPTSLQS